MLHGFGGNYRSWIDAVDIADLADRSQCVLVCPDGSRSSWYLNSPIDTLSQYETFVVHDVIPWVNRHLPVDSSRNGRAITGISMGGHGGLYLAIRHHGLFAAAGTISGVLDLWDTTQPRELSRRLGTTEDYPDRWEEYSVINMVDSLRGVDIDIVIDCGVDDPFIDNNRAVHERLLDLGIPHDYSERPGGHTWLFWKRAVEYQMMFFGESFRRRRSGG